MEKNVFGTNLLDCGGDPMTGYYRNGCCESDEDDRGMHTVCAVMSMEFLDFSKSQGNDLITPKPQYDFPGLREGDRWCLCIGRWMEALHAGMAPKVILEATHEKTLDHVSLEDLIKFAYK